ncbi:MAG TPA: arginase family protein [Draconibacterium sp.]|nr:arginase family protein [Draconibacterium sp.]
MDIRYYFTPVDFSTYYNSGHLTWKYSLGAVVEKNSLALTKENIHKLNIAIVGVPFDSRKEDNYSPQATDKIRAELYQLAKFNNKINIADFGNLKPASSIKGYYQALRDIADYFNELKIVTVVIGGSQDLSIGICEAFTGDPYFSYSTIDAFLDVKRAKEPFDSSNYLSRLFSNQPQLFQFNLIGFQSHYIAYENLSKIKCISEHIRLGNLRDNIMLAEPVLRNTDFLSFDINSVKHSEAPGSLRITPNGLRSEEACQLAKYAGLSGRLKVFGLFEVFEENDRENLTVNLAAQLIWYFLEGCINRDNDKPDSNENNIMYQVEVDSVDKPIIFFKDSVTNQWWLQIETSEKRKLYFGCSEKEYEQASNNEIPELWLKYIQKIDVLLK